MRAMLNHLPVIHESLAPAFPAEARFLVAAERRRRIELVEGVRPDDAGLEQRAHLEDARALVGPDSSGEAVHRVVRLFDGFFEGAEGEHAQHRAKDFFARDTVALGDTGEYRRLEVEPLRWKVAHGGLIQLGAAANSGIDKLTDAIELRARVDRADVGVLVERIADAQHIDPAFELRHEELGDRFLDEESRAGAADVTLVEEDPVDYAFDRLVDRRIVEDDVRRFSTQLEGEFFVRSRELPHDQLADVSGAGERDLGGSWMSDNGPARLARATDKVHDARRQLGLEKQLCKFQRGNRGRFGRLEHDRVSHRERGRDFPRQHEQGEIPRDDLTDYSERNHCGAGHGVLELVGPARVIEEVRGGHWNVEVARLLDRLPAIHCFGDGELTGAILDETGDPVEILPALAAGQLAPRRKRSLRCLKSSVDVGCGSQSD